MLILESAAGTLIAAQVVYIVVIFTVKLKVKVLHFPMIFSIFKKKYTTFALDQSKIVVDQKKIT